MRPSLRLSKNVKMVEWIAIVYDRPNGPRLQHRAAHLAALPSAFNGGKVVSAGAIFNKVPQEGTAPDFAGSVVNVIADTKEEVIEVLKQDVYYKENVWDLEKALIYPIGIAARVGKDL